MQKIVVGYDGTRPAERALERAAELAKAFGGKVIVVSVVAPEPVDVSGGAFGLMPYSMYDSGQTHPRTDEALWDQHRGRIQSLLSAAGVDSEFLGVVGQPAAEIVEAAETAKADLIVVGTREPGLLERLFGGSVSQGVARHASCDVLIVHSDT